MTLIESLKYSVPTPVRNTIRHVRKSPAFKALKQIERIKGELPASVRKKCDAYAVEVLGGRQYSEWLYVYSLMAGEFREGWIPDEYYGRVVIPRIKGAYRGISELNALQSVLFDRKRFPDLAYSVNGAFYDTGFNRLDAPALRRLLRDRDAPVLFKKDQSLRGKGVIRIDDDSRHDRLGDLGDGVFQSYIDQHDTFRAFHDRSVATMRLTTVMEDDGTASLRAAYLRFGTGDDTHIRSGSSIRVPVSPISGTVLATGYTEDWGEVTRHPDSGETFGGTTIPNFDACMRAALELQEAVPFVGCVGWDVTVTRNGDPMFMEWNGDHNGIKFSEATAGPCFRGLGWETLWRQ